MKNLKKIALSLLVVGLAVGFSAFTNAEKEIVVKAGFDTANYGYNGSTGLYQHITGTVSVPANCEESIGRCVVIYTYEITTPPATPPATLSKAIGDALPLYSGATENARYF